MALEQITAGIITSAVRILIAMFIFGIYYKNRNKIALYFGLFFTLFAVHGIFRTLSITTGEPFWFFLHKIALVGGSVFILQGLGEMGIEWIKKYFVAPILAVIAVLLAYYNAYLAGGIAGEAENIWLSLPSFALSGIGLILAGYYFYAMGKDLPTLGKNIMVAGFILEGLLNFAVLWLIPAGLTGLAFYMGLLFTAMIGLGWMLSLSAGKEEVSPKKKLK